MDDRIERDIEIDETVVVRPGAPGQADTAAIHAEIRDTRERMGHTLEDIGERLSPDHLKSQVKDNIREATIGRAETMARHAVGRADETRHNLMDTIRDNPVPAAMVGVGLGWLFWNGRREHSYADINVQRRYDRDWDEWEEQGWYDEADLSGRSTGRRSRAKHRAEDLAHKAEDTVGDLADRTRETTSEAMDRTQEAVGRTAARARSAASHLAEETRYRTHRIEDRFDAALHDSPLAVGAAAMAIGLAAGFSAPATRRESELVGGARDRLADRAREIADETSTKVQHVAERVMDEAESEARQAARDEKLSSPTSPANRTGYTAGGAGDTPQS